MTRKPSTTERGRTAKRGTAPVSADGGAAQESPAASRPAWRYAVALLVLLVLLAVGAALWGARGLRANAEPAPSRVAAPRPVERLSVRIHARYPHDRSAFTEGLVWDRGRLFESTGLAGQSTLREVDYRTGNVRRRVVNAPDLFAEGLALVDGTLIQLTWHEERALFWSNEGFASKGERRYPGEGWGLCYDGTSLVMSDGSDVLSFRDKESFALQRTLTVTREGRSQAMINELECALGKVYANIWMTDEIVRIDPETGVVEGVVTASGLLAGDETRGVDVLNGIAFMPETKHFLITGKLWPAVFEVTFESAQR